MSIRTGKGNKLFLLIAALATRLAVSAAPASRSGSEGSDPDADAAPAPSHYPQAQPPDGFHSEYAEVNGFRMHYLRGGSGSPVVLIHGFPHCWAEWRRQMGPLSRDHTVIAVDLRGTGNSQVTEGGYQAAQLAEDVHELLKQLGLNEGVQIVAHDVGMWVAYDYAAQWPSEVRRMAVMEAPLPNESIYCFPVLNADPGRPAAWHFGMFQLPLAEHLIAGHERVFIQEMMASYLAGNKSPFTASDYEFYAHYLKEPGRTTAWMNVYRGLRANIQQNKEFRARGKLRMPILAIGADGAFGEMVESQWRDYAENVQGRILKDSGHFVTEEKPQEVTELLQSFLQR
ncbi:alpha/beta fold hydrolase [Actinacidiphila acidipaludis]|uniref:Alpha/beta hydrolase n=1 Tax=Actinacidiphila acidipaludis TaxID=2873382 RepID=A0ABS7Q3U2_9ACTN|nr:alpha/beta hydrolase [Streptomyces acidipaludis]MBY8877369.1 alpha/beta hydrolase [Streptomyces acidipaludis]